MQKVLLLGGSVFVGRALLQRLIAQGFDVTAVTRGLVQADWGAAHHIACDRRDAHQLASRLRGHTFDAVVDASCYGPEDCRALLAGLQAMPTTYVLLSSAAVYQRSTAPLPFSEASPAHGDDIWGTYGRDKAAAETVLSESSIPRQFVVRPPYIHGPGNNLDRERFVWARQLAQAPIFVPADGETLIQFVGIDDLTRAIVGFLDPRCAVAPGIYNLASPTYVSFNQYIALLGQIAGRQSHVVHVSDSTIPAREYFPLPQGTPDLVDAETGHLERATSDAACGGSAGSIRLDFLFLPLHRGAIAKRSGLAAPLRTRRVVIGDGRDRIGRLTCSDAAAVHRRATRCCARNCGTTPVGAHDATMLVKNAALAPLVCGAAH